MLKIGIIGASGYTASGLLTILRNHPGVQLRCLASRQLAGKQLAVIDPTLAQLGNLQFCSPDSSELYRCDLVFCATPHAVAMRHAEALLSHGVKVIDLSPDFRLQDVQLWQQWYGCEHACPQLLPQAVYGLPEFYREQIKTAQLIANPGCYATLTQLLLRPLLATEAAATALDLSTIVVDAKSGSSGAGKKLAEHLLFCEVSENIAAYASAGHRHIPEIKASLQALGGNAWDLVFVPHLLPMLQGMQATVYIPLRAQLDFQQLYSDFYQGEPFVHILPPGSHPASHSVRGGNHCLLAISQQAKHLVLMGVIDNLGKGACGQAVQNMNLCLGLPETAGL